MRGEHTRARRRVWLRLIGLLSVASGIVVATHSVGGISPSGSSSGPVSGLTGLGATQANWARAHGAPSSSGSAYGPSVDTGAGTEARYTAVTFSGGRVSGWVMSFPAGTTVLSADHSLRSDLPTNSQQTSSSRQTASSGSAACEVVGYRSNQLALAFQGNSGLTNGKFTVSFFEVQPNGSISPSYATVNRAIVGAPSPVPEPSCPS